MGQAVTEPDFGTPVHSIWEMDFYVSRGRKRSFSTRAAQISRQLIA